MKKLFKKILNNKILIIILLLIVFAFPSAMLKKAQGEITTIVVAIGIDKEENKFKVSIQSANKLIQQNKSGDASNEKQSQNMLEVISDSGITLADAFNSLEIKTGKNLGFEHCHLIVLGDSVASENCKSILDVLYRKANITLGAYLVSTDVSAEDILKKTASFENASSGNLEKNLGFNKNNYSTSDLTTLGDFFNDYQSQSKISTMLFLKSDKPEEKPQEESKIENEGKTSVFYGGEKVDVLDEQLTHGLNWVNLEKISGNITISGVSDDKFFNNATITIDLNDATIKKKVYIKDDKLTLSLSIELKIEILEIVQENNSLSLNEGYNDYLTEALKNKIKEKIVNEINSIHNYSKQNKIDVCNIKNLFYAFKNAEYKNWLNKHSIEDIYENSVIECEVKTFAFR